MPPSPARIHFLMPPSPCLSAQPASPGSFLQAAAAAEDSTVPDLIQTDTYHTAQTSPTSEYHAGTFLALAGRPNKFGCSLAERGRSKDGNR
jgi:hypothetical protein